VDDIEYDSDDPDVADVSDYDDSEDDYITFTISSYDEGSATITFDLEIDGDDYSIDCDVNVNDSSSGDGLSLDETDLSIGEGSSEYVEVYLPSGFDNGDIDSVSYTKDDPYGVIDRITYDKNDDTDDYVTYRIYAKNKADEDASITFKIQLNGDWYYSDKLDVTVQ
jgi:hypothetical protein